MENSTKNNQETTKNKPDFTNHIDPKTLPKENIDFVQIQNNALKPIQGLIANNPVSAQILFFLIDKMGSFNNSVICSYQTFIELTGYSRATIARAIKYLKDNKWIDTIKVGSATAYCVNAQVAWRKARNQKHYAIFSSTIVATSTENDNFESDKKLRNIPHEISKNTKEQLAIIEEIQGDLERELLELAEADFYPFDEDSSLPGFSEEELEDALRDAASG